MQLIRQPRLFPCMFFDGVLFVFIIFLFRPDQVFDVKAGDGKFGHGVSLRKTGKGTVEDRCVDVAACNDRDNSIMVQSIRMEKSRGKANGPTRLNN